MTYEQGILPPIEANFRRRAIARQENLTKSGGKRPAQTAFNGYEYRFLECSECGWQKDKYVLYNWCLRNGRFCKRHAYIENYQDETECAFSDMDSIFLDKKCGSITTYLFGYCLASLFSSRLNNDNLYVPYFLQIACERNSNTYRLIHEIVDICDVNAALEERCSPDFEYKHCECDHITLFADRTFDDITYYRDIPVVIDGYEDEQSYQSLLRKTANIRKKNKRLDGKAQFNVLPIFISSKIHFQYRNFFCINLTDLDVDEEYLKLIERNKPNLASWSFELVSDAKYYFGQENLADDKFKHRSEDERPFFDNIDRHINSLRQKHRHLANLNSKDIRNIGYLTYFFSRYMNVFQRSLRLSYETSFTYREQNAKHNRSKLVKTIVDEATDLLFKLNDACSPTLQTTVSVNADGVNSIEKEKVKKKGKQYARDIVKYYQSYGVNLGISSSVEYKDNRYVFSVKLRPGTDEKLISRYAGEVRRLLEVEFLYPEVSFSSIKLIISEKPLQECSLRRILENDKFKCSKMEIPYAVGYDMMGKMVIEDVAQFPHLLIGGATGFGKSSALHSLLMSIVYKQPAEKVKLLLLDFGGSRLKIFDATPHMLTPTITTGKSENGKQAILWLQQQMNHRIKEQDSADERSYEKLQARWPSIVCVIDEFPSFIDQYASEKKHTGLNMTEIIEDLLARARKVKIHLVLAAQETTKEGMKIKNTNLVAGIAFQCENWHNSKAIIGVSDATKLSGKGEMYFKYNGIKRLQGAYMEPKEIIDMLDSMNFDHYSRKGHFEEIRFEIEPDGKPTQEIDSLCSDIIKDNGEQVIVEMVEWIWNNKKEKISNKQLKDEFKIGYDKANRFLDQLEAAEIISAQRKGTKLPREVNLGKVEEFLKSHKCIDDVAKKESGRSQSTLNMQSGAGRKNRGIIVPKEHDIRKDALTRENLEILKMVRRGVKQKK